jgi:WhiB family redox-sensing transcriptional regulator
MTTRPLPKSWIPPAVEPQPAWMKRARCLSGDEHPDQWFPEGERKVPAERRAIQACRACPVRLACLQYALEIESGLGEQSRHGIWGAMTPGQRAKLAAGKREETAA